MMMKARWICIFVLFFVLSSLAQTAPASLPPRLLLELSDGSAQTFRAQQILPKFLQAFAPLKVKLTPVFYEPNSQSKQKIWYELGMNRWFRVEIEKTASETVAKILLKNNELIDLVLCYPDEMQLVPDDFSLHNLWGVTQMQLPLAWDIQQGSAEIIVTTIDTGCRTDHEDLAANMRINSGEDLNHNGFWDESDNDSLDSDDNGFIDDLIGYDFVSASVLGSSIAVDEDYEPRDNLVSDVVGHGTHVMGCASAVTNNSIGVASPSWNVLAMPCRAGFGWVDPNGTLRVTGYHDDFIAAIQYATDNGANIISISFGGSTNNPAYQAAITYARTNNVLVFCAAGNNNNSNLFYPAAYDSAFAVAATGTGDLRATYSNYGTYIDFCAPGNSIWSTLPNSFYSGADYGSMSGTSMASPLAAGVAALVWSVNPNFTAQEMEIFLRGGCVNIDALNPSYAGQLGAGRLSAFNSITLSLTNPCADSTPAAPKLTVYLNGLNTELRWSRVNENQAGCPLEVSDYSLYCDEYPDGIFGTLLTTTADTFFTDVNSIASPSQRKFYRVISRL